MSRSSNNDLLTVGQTFKTVAEEFKIIRKVGRGATGEVYEAQSRDGKRTVAIKVMRPTDMQLARKLFIGEGLILARMRSVEKKAGDGFFVTPEYLDAEEKTDIPYLVEEFMTGRSFPDLLSSGHLSEETVVAIGVQFFRTLHLLSKELKKNYIDLKLENLWWDQEKKTLKITDWGTLEDANPNGQSRDILRASLYIYRLATGRPITERRGILNQAVDAYPEWEQLSWGLQEIMRRLLHPSPSARVGDDLLSLDSAEKIAQAFRNLDEYWKEPADELIEDIRRSVDAAQKSNPDKEIDQQTLHYRLARTALEVASKRGIPTREYDDRLRSIIIAESDYFTRARNLYEGTSYAPARKLFQIGSKLLSSSKLRRWAWLAYAGELAREENYRKVKASVEHAVELMEQGQYPDASTNLEGVLKSFQSEALQTLWQECQVLNLVQQAVFAQRDGEYESAEHAYRRAHEIWIKTNDHDKWKDLVGDLLRQADVVRRQGEDRKKAKELLELVEAATDLPTILDRLGEVFWQVSNPGSDAYEIAFKLADGRFNNGLLEDAARILWVAGRAPSVPPDFSDWYCPEEIRIAMDPEKGRLYNVLAYVPLIRREKNSLTFNITIGLLKKSFIRPDDFIGLYRVEMIADLALALDADHVKMKEQAQAWREEITKVDKEKVNRLIAKASSLMYVDAPGALQNLSVSQAFSHLGNRLLGIEQALELLDQAARLVEREDESEKSRIEDLKQRGAVMKNELNRLSSENKVQIEKVILELKTKADDILSQLEQLEKVFPILSKVGLPSRISDNMSEFQVERLGEVYDLCTQVLDLDTENQWALQTQQKVKGKIQGFGDFAVFAIVSQKNVVDAAVDALLREAGDFYQKGRVWEAARSLRKVEALDPQASSQRPFMELKAKTTVLLGVMYWEQENKGKLEAGEFEPQLLKSIAAHFSTDIPPQFRRDSVLQKYLIATRKGLIDQLTKINPTNSPSEYANAIRNLLWTDNLYRRGLIWQQNRVIGQKDGKWNSAKFVESLLRAYKKGDFGRQVEKLLAALPIFQDPEASSAKITSDLVAQKVQELFRSKVPPPPIPATSQGGRLKWVAGVETVILVLGIVAIAALFVVPNLGTRIIVPLFPVPTVLTNEVVTEVPTEIATAVPTEIATEAPTEIATEVSTETPVPLIPNYCIKPSGKIRAQPQIVDTPTSNVVFTASDSSICLYFDASLTANGYPWYRIADGQKIGDLDVSGYWIGNPAQWLTNWVLPTVTPTP